MRDLREEEVVRHVAVRDVVAQPCFKVVVVVEGGGGGGRVSRAGGRSVWFLLRAISDHIMTPHATHAPSMPMPYSRSIVCSAPLM